MTLMGQISVSYVQCHSMLFGGLRKTLTHKEGNKQARNLGELLNLPSGRLNEVNSKSLT